MTVDTLKRSAGILVYLLFVAATAASQSPPTRSASLRATPSEEQLSLELSLDTLPTPIASAFLDQERGYGVEDLVRIATERSRELLAARQNIVIGQGRIVQAGLRPNPLVNYDATNDRAFSAEGEGAFGLSYLQPIELGGKRGKRLELAGLELEQAQAALAFRERQLQVDTKSQYAEALAAVENLRAVEQLRQLDEGMLRLTQARLIEGDVAKLDVNLVRVEVNRLRAQQLQFENRVKAALLRLRTLSGMDADQALKLRGELQTQSVELTLEAAEQLALQNRDDLKAARLAEMVAAAEIRLANAQAVPDVTAFVGYRRERSVFGAASLGPAFNSTDLIPGASLSDTDRFLNFGMSVQLPFFNRNQGVIQEATGQLTQARHTREFVELAVKRDVAIALNRYQSARESVDLFQQEILPSGRDNLQIVNALYTAGQQQIFEVIAEQRRFIDSQSQYVEALKEYYLSLVELERATGRPLP